MAQIELFSRTTNALDELSLYDRKQKNFHNTTNESGTDLKEAIDKCTQQDNEVLAFFRSKQGKSLTPFEVHKGCLQNAPITSVRRSINTLTGMGYLEKTDEKRKGEFGRMNYTWKYISG